MTDADQRRLVTIYEQLGGDALSVITDGGPHRMGKDNIDCSNEELRLTLILNAMSHFPKEGFARNMFYDISKTNFKEKKDSVDLLLENFDPKNIDRIEQGIFSVFYATPVSKDYMDYCVGEFLQDKAYVYGQAASLGVVKLNFPQLWPVFGSSEISSIKIEYMQNMVFKHCEPEYIRIFLSVYNEDNLVREAINNRAALYFMLDALKAANDATTIGRILEQMRKITKLRACL